MSVFPWLIYTNYVKGLEFEEGDYFLKIISMYMVTWMLRTETSITYCGMWDIIVKIKIKDKT